MKNQFRPSYGAHEYDPFYKAPPSVIPPRRAATPSARESHRMPFISQSMNQLRDPPTPKPVQYAKKKPNADTDLPKDFLQPVPEDAKKYDQNSLLHRHRMRQASYKKLTGGSEPAPEHFWAPSFSHGAQQEEARRSVAVGAVDANTYNAYHGQQNSITGPCYFLMPGMPPHLGPDLAPGNYGAGPQMMLSESVAYRSNTLAKPDYTFGTKVIVRKSNKHPWKVGSYIGSDKFRELGGSERWIFRVEPAILDFAGPKYPHNKFTIENISEIPCDNSPITPGSKYYARELLSALAKPPKINSFLFAIIPTPVSTPIPGDIALREMWQPVVCLKDMLPNYGFSVRVVAGPLYGKEYVVYNVKPFTGEPSTQALLNAHSVADEEYPSWYVTPGQAPGY